MTVLFEGETDILGSESFRFSGGMSLFRRCVWILSISFVGWSLLRPIVPAVVTFLKTAAAFLTTPDLWLAPMKVWPDVPALPAIALVLFALAIVLAMISIVGVCIVRPIVTIALVQKRHEKLADIVGIAGKSYYIISDDDFYIRNCSSAGERTMRFNWAAIDQAVEHSGVVRLSFRNKTVAQVPLRAFGDQQNAVRQFLNSVGSQNKAVRKWPPRRNPAATSHSH